jgi:ABC-type uncharacterized transport system auxiliary subunit
MKNYYLSLSSRLRWGDVKLDSRLHGNDRRVQRRVPILNIVILGMVGIVCLLCTGCISVKNFTPQQYQLEVPSPKPVAHKAEDKVLEINNAVIAPQFTSLGFVYRTAELKYTIDYYNIFFTPPAQQINKIMVNYVRAKNIFSYVTSDVGQLNIDYVLYPEITALYADYRDSKRPLAVVAIDCTVFPSSKTNKPLLHKLYAAKVPIIVKDSESLVKAWNQGLQRILSDISTDLMNLSHKQ